MNEQDKKRIVDTLRTLRSESMALQNRVTDSNVQALMQKYNMLFIGEKCNQIYSDEFCCMLNTELGVNVSPDEFNSVITELCATLDMSIVPMIKLDDTNKPNPPIDHYRISLY